MAKTEEIAGKKIRPIRKPLLFLSLGARASMPS
jgi:hypothetical protein